MYLACIKYFNICIKKFVSTKPTIRIALELLKIKCITIDKCMDQFDGNYHRVSTTQALKKTVYLKIFPKITLHIRRLTLGVRRSPERRVFRLQIPGREESKNFKLSRTY